MQLLTDLAQTDLPEVFYGRNHFYAVMADKNVLIEIDPVEQVSFSQFAKREKTIRTSL